MNVIDELRKPKIFGIAIFDTVGSILAFYFIAKYFNIPYPALFGIFSIPASIIIHKLIGVETKLTKKLNI